MTYSSRIFIGFEKIARMIIEKGANVNVVNQSKETALVLAAKTGDTDQMKLCSLETLT